MALRKLSVDVAQVKQLRDEGNSYTKIAKALNIRVNVLRRAVHEAGLPWEPVDVRLQIDLNYASVLIKHHTLKFTANKLGVDAGTLKNHLKRHNLLPPPPPPCPCCHQMETPGALAGRGGNEQQPATSQLQI